MILLYAIFCQWFSRGCLLRCCLAQEKWEILVIVFLIGIILAAPIQGDISDKSSRKKLLIITILCVILSLFIVGIVEFFPLTDYFPIILAVACIINGVFGNVFPVAAAAYSEQVDSFQKALQRSLPCRYIALGIPFLIKLPFNYSFLIALIINQIAFLLIAFKFKDKQRVQG